MPLPAVTVIFVALLTIKLFKPDLSLLSPIVTPLFANVAIGLDVAVSAKPLPLITIVPSSLTDELGLELVIPGAVLSTTKAVPPAAVVLPALSVTIISPP